MRIVALIAEYSRWLMVLLCLAAASGRADVLPVANGSFEAPTLGREGEQAANAAEGWTIEGTAGVLANNGAFGNKMDGADAEQAAFLNGSKAGSLAQVVAKEIQPLTAYSVTAAVG